MKGLSDFLAALRDPGWTDPDVANVAKGLAGDMTLKNAARLFAQALTGDAAQALDDHQMRDVFITFGRAFVSTLKTLFKEQAERWSGSIETQQRLMKMVVQLLEKEQPGIAEALARLVASGRFNTVRDLLSEGLNDIHARKMDFMVLSQYNLMGPPAGMPEEPVDTIPDVGKFASRDVMKTGLPLLDTGPMEYAIDVSPDESAVTVHAKSVFPVHADVTLPTTMIGTCTISQEFVIDLSGEDPEIRDFKIGQALE